jgi:hypothetical protein
VNCVSNAAKLLEMVMNGFPLEAVRDYGHSDGGDRVVRSPTIHQSIGTGCSGDTGGEAGAVTLKKVN